MLLRSVAELAAERLVLSAVNGQKEAEEGSKSKTELGSSEMPGSMPGHNSEKLSRVPLNGVIGQKHELNIGSNGGEGRSSGNAILCEQRSRYELEREKEREQERAMEQQRPQDRVKELELHLARTRGTALDGQSVGASAQSKFVVEGTDELHFQSFGIKAPRRSPERKYGDTKIPPPSAFPGPAATGNGERGEEDDDDEDLAIAIYFDEVMKLLCQLPATARAMRRDLAAEIAKALRVLPERFTLLEMYEGPVAEMIVSNMSTQKNNRQHLHDEYCTNLKLVERLSNMITSGLLPQYSSSVQQYKFFRNISSVKNRGAAAEARPLSVMLRPLKDAIADHLSSLNTVTMDARDEVSAYKESRSTQEAENDLNISSDSDVTSLTYTASVHTVQVSLTDSQMFFLSLSFRSALTLYLFRPFFLSYSAKSLVILF